MCVSAVSGRYEYWDYVTKKTRLVRCTVRGRQRSKYDYKSWAWIARGSYGDLQKVWIYDYNSGSEIGYIVRAFQVVA